MSPGRPGSLEILDLDVVRGRARLTRQRVVVPAGETLEVALPGSRVPDGFAATNEGAFHFKLSEGISSVVRNLGSPDVLREPGGAERYRYRWASAAKAGAHLCALVLPRGYRLAMSDPPPVAATVSGERLVALWTHVGSAIDLDMDVFDGDPRAEADRLNRQTRSTGKLPSSEGIRIVQPLTQRKRTWVWVAAAFLTIAVIGYVFIPPDDDNGRTDADPTVLTGQTSPAVISAGYAASHALVVGIDHYPADRWLDLSYATRDAEGIARLLERQGFDVEVLLNDEATKLAILRYLENDLAPRLQTNDRVLFFFAGHGHTERFGDKSWGYLVPRDGDSDSATYISMDKLRELASKMDVAKHQLYILDACFGGSIATRSGSLDSRRADYLDAVMLRTARQVLTAGGESDVVVDGDGPEGYGMFVGHLLEALEHGLADTDSDGYVTASDLYGYLRTVATNDYQSPGFSTLPGHGMGEFVFELNRAAVDKGSPDD